MGWVSLVLPLIGIVVAMSVPLVRYAVRERDERVAIEVLHSILDAQQTFRSRNGGYATDPASLVTACGEVGAPLSHEELDRLQGSGYVLHLRPGTNGTTAGADCRGRPLTSDFYVSIGPSSPAAAGQQAFAARSEGRIYLYYDGIPPVEADIESGLATPLEKRDSFRIP